MRRTVLGYGLPQVAGVFGAQEGLLSRHRRIEGPNPIWRGDLRSGEEIRSPTHSCDGDMQIYQKSIPTHTSPNNLGSYVPATALRTLDGTNVELIASTEAVDEEVHNSEMILESQGDGIPVVLEETLVPVPIHFAARARGLLVNRGRGRRRAGQRALLASPPVIMKILAWNCQGLGSSWTVRVLNELIRLHNPGLVFLSETKCKRRKCEILKEKHNLFGINVDSNGKGGGLMLLWRKDVNLIVHSFSSSHIDAGISSEAGTNGWRFTGVYGQPEVARRDDTWRLLRHLSSLSSRPWICASDFNEVLKQDEKTGAPRPRKQIEDFRSCLADCQLMDLGCSGYRFTWCNQREAPNTVRVRLDRACATLDWRNLFPTAQVVALSAKGSDHNPLLIALKVATGFVSMQRRKLFRFEAMWARSAECEALVQDLWGRDCHGAAGTRVMHRIQRIRAGLMEWDKLKFGNVRRRIKELETLLLNCSKDPISDDNGFVRSRLRNELEELLTWEEILWKQRGKAQWLCEGDRIPLISIQGLVLENEKTLFLVLGVVTAIGVIPRKTSNPSEEAIDKVLGGMPAKVTDDMNEALIQPFVSEEVKLAISHMYPYKSPGPDGLSPVFYQNYWHIVGPEIISFVLDFLNHGHFDVAFNYTFIVLIPKCDSPENMSHFRPISLCNITYKIASKMLANRLKPFLPHIISETQSAFVPGRLITDNILVAYELNHFLAHKTWGSKGHAAIKLDLSKAYDRVEWIFLESVLAKLGFHHRFISLINLCVSTVSYLFIIDGQKFGYVCCYGVCESDSSDFEAASGLMANLNKSSVAFSPNVPNTLQEDLAGRLGIRAVSRHEKYLGLPALVGRSKKEVFQSLTDKVWMRLQSWRCKNLSQAGKVVLIKYVVIAMPTFVMGCFLIPTTICRQLEGLMADFIWHNKDSRKVHWLSWQKLCASKKEGGLGFRMLGAFNRVMLAKQLWRILMNPDSLLSRLLKHKYFPSTDVLSAVAGQGSSFTWRSMIEARDLIVAGLRWQVGSCRNIRIWKDGWIPRPLTFRVLTTPNSMSEEATVDVLLGENGDWNVELIRNVFCVMMRPL
ncbi:UNVERIFIED_CONTAM: putative mitochondrial protein [Sesamum radiatum]|uniref:Mitochondrial protein n=1 Tax=Sesamum radiatum TaxID=300843 RepID=A0AAW2NS56_SESRA